MYIHGYIVKVCFTDVRKLKHPKEMVKLIVKCGNNRPDEVYMEEIEPVWKGLKGFYKERLQSCPVENMMLQQTKPGCTPHCLDGEAVPGIPAKYLAHGGLELILQENDSNKTRKFDVICKNGSDTIFEQKKVNIKFAAPTFHPSQDRGELISSKQENETSSSSKFNRKIKSFVEAAVLREISSLDTSVCAIMSPDLPDATCMKGSGFLIAPGLIITNYHVIFEFIKLQNVYQALLIHEDLDLRCLSFPPVACFYSDFLEQPDPQKETERQKMCFRLGKVKAFQKDHFDPERDLDYVIAEIEKIETDSNFEPVAPSFDVYNEREQQVHIMGWKMDHDVREKVIDMFCPLIQSPMGFDKDVIDFKGLAILCKYNPYKVNYHSGLYQGSSGSPVFNNQGRVIAMHTEGVKNQIESEYKYFCTKAALMVTIIQHACDHFPSLQEIFFPSQQIPECIRSFSSNIAHSDMPDENLSDEFSTMSVRANTRSGNVTCFGNILPNWVIRLSNMETLRIIMIFMVFVSFT